MPGSWQLLPTTRSLLTQPRVLLAVKAAIASGLAWWIAPHLPGVAAEYPYYAPLGALVSMYPTIRASVGQALQTLAGLILGIGLAAGVMAIGDPNVLTVALVIGVGVILGGLPFLGAGRDWVPMAALFVLLIGGSNGQDYSLGYAEQMLVGLVVGIVVNLLLIPPLYTSRAQSRLGRLRGELADRADDVAGVFRASWPLADHDWAGRVEALPVTLARVEEALRFSDESGRLNPRRFVTRQDLSGHRDELLASQRIAFHLRDMAEVSGQLARRAGGGIRAADGLADPLARALESVAALLRTRPLDPADAVSAARTSMDQAWAAVDRLGIPAQETGGAVSVVVALTRIVDALDTREGTENRRAQYG